MHIMEKKTLVIGASPRSHRYSHKAVLALRAHGHDIVALGLHPGVIGDTPIVVERPPGSFDTVTLYVGPGHQPGYYDYIMGMRPRRVIFNPGTENPEFQQMLASSGIIAEEACTLVLLSIGQY